MPQELRVVRCFQCLKYQVDIVKKANKWACKLCGVKQSLAREFFRGSGKDCRSVVQQLSIRNLEMDQQEAEVTKLVLQNKIQLPAPPMERVTQSAITEMAETSPGPSKWETFLAKETDDDLAGTICSSESLESVSSTTFDRERINNPIYNFAAKGATQWNYQRMKGEDLFDNNEKWPSNLDKGSSSRKKLAIEHQKPVFNPSRSANNAKSDTFFNNPGSVKRGSYSAGNDSMALPNFHHKENVGRRTFANPTKKDFSQASVPKTSISEVPSSSGIYKPPEMPCKRKISDVFATPLMNFGKRTVDESKLTPSAEPLRNVEDTKPQTESKIASNASSKWAKYLPEDDVTNENTDNFIIF